MAKFIKLHRKNDRNINHELVLNSDLIQRVDDNYTNTVYVFMADGTTYAVTETLDEIFELVNGETECEKRQKNEKLDKLIQCAFDVVKTSIIAGKYNIPCTMTFALNNLQDAVSEYANEQKIDVVPSAEFKKFSDEYWKTIVGGV